MKVAMNNTTKGKTMNNDYWEIFDNSDGIIITGCYGYGNAILQAKQLAQKLKKQIGIWSKGQKTEIYRPLVSLGWVPPVEPFYCEKCGTEKDNSWLDDGYTCPTCKHIN